MISKLTNLSSLNRWLVLALTVGMIAAMVLPAHMAFAQTTNLAAGKTPTGSVTINAVAYVTDGDKTTANYAGQEVGAQWIRIDLGQSYNLTQVNVWHYFGNTRSYHDVIVQVSNDLNFGSGVTTVFNNDANNVVGQGAGGDLEYTETSAGKTITFSAVSARYVRLWANGSTANAYNHYVEVEVYAGSGGATATNTNTSVAPTATRTNTPIGPTATRTNTPASSGDLALNKTATASSVEANTTFVAANAVDGNATTRWGSTDPATNAEWIYVDLGATSTVARVVLSWEAAYATSYQVQTSNDATNWTNIYTTTTGNGATDDLTGLSGSGRYVRVYMTVRGSAYGYSLWSFEVYGTGGPAPTNTAVGPTATRTNTPAPTATNSSTCQANGSVWSGHNWNVTNGGMAGIINGAPANVWTDSNCYLHLRVVNNGGTWTGAELFTTDKVGFGTYQWQVEGNNLDYMDKAIVLGLYPYGRAANIGADGENEIDIELSRWDDFDCPPCNGDFTVYPSTGNGGLGQNAYLFNPPFDLPAGNQQVTGRFVWSSTSVKFYLMSGFQSIDATPTNILMSWTFAPSNYTKSIPQVALPFGMNLWAYRELPSAGQEVIIRNFQYKP